MKLELQFFPESKVLIEQAEPVERFDSELSDIVNGMVTIMVDNDGIGLAAPQVGIGKRLFVFKSGKQGPNKLGLDIFAVVNPTIESFSTDKTIFREGCLSLPGLYSDIERPAEIKFSGWNQRGYPIASELNGMESRVFQHEFDHLRGWLFPFYKFISHSKPLAWTITDVLTNNLLEVQRIK